jgi:hypothetical protein
MKGIDIFNALVSPSFVLRSRPDNADGIACPKCRWAGKPDEDWRKYIWASPTDCEKLGVLDEKGNPVTECLMVTCSRCNFRWREDVAEPDKVDEPS